VVGGNTVKAAAVHNEDSRFHTDAGYAEDMLIGGTVDIHREELGMAQGPAEFGIDIKVKVGWVEGLNRLYFYYEAYDIALSKAEERLRKL